MSLSKSKRDQLSMRREIERTLFVIGLTKADVATAMNLDKGSVDNDFRHLNGEINFLRAQDNASKTRDEVYRTAILNFIHMFFNKKAEWPEHWQGVYKALANYVDLKRLRAIAEGVAATITQMMEPSAEFYNYGRFLRAIFGEYAGGSPNRDSVLGEFFQAVEVPGKYNVPTRDNIAMLMAQWAKNEYASHFRPTLTAELIPFVDKALKTLSPQLEKILRFRLAIGEVEGVPVTETCTLETVAEKLGLDRERIRQLEYKALRQLRNLENSQLLKFWVTPPEETARFCVLK